MIIGLMHIKKVYGLFLCHGGEAVNAAALLMRMMHQQNFQLAALRAPQHQWCTSEHNFSSQAATAAT